MLKINFCSIFSTALTFLGKSGSCYSFDTRLGIIGILILSYLLYEQAIRQTIFQKKNLYPLLDFLLRFFWAIILIRTFTIRSVLIKWANPYHYSFFHYGLLSVVPTLIKVGLFSLATRSMKILRRPAWGGGQSHVFFNDLF